MKAEIITIGTEILLGQTVDTNSAWLGSSLAGIGLDVHRIISIPDTPEAIENALDSILESTNWIFITGGLGPTKDDLTKGVLTRYFGDELVFRSDIYAHIRDLFSKMGRLPNILNKEQALFPKSAKFISNSRGTAQSMLWDHNGKKYVSLPGVPYEMIGIMEDNILPHIKDGQKTFLESRYFMIQGIPESELASRLQKWEETLESPLSIAYLPSPGLVKLRLTCRGKIDSAQVLLNKLDQGSEEIRKILGDDIYAERLIGIEEVISELLKKSNQTLATAESFTGGSIAAKLVSISGASKFFKGSVVAYSNEIKISELEVSKSSLLKYGAVSRPVAIQMSQNVKEKYNSDWSISTTGFAGEDPSGELPEGTIWIAISGPGVEWAKKFNMGSNRNRTISKSTLTALNQLRIFLRNQDLDGWEKTVYSN